MLNAFHVNVVDVSKHWNESVSKSGNVTVVEAVLVVGNRLPMDFTSGPALNVVVENASRRIASSLRSAMVPQRDANRLNASRTDTTRKRKLTVLKAARSEEVVEWRPSIDAVHPGLAFLDDRAVWIHLTENQCEDTLSLLAREHHLR